MRILLVGSGGREHALAQALAASPTCSDLHCAPGNPGIARVATCHDVAVDDVGGLVALAHHLEIGLVVVGPELPLVLGLGDALRRARIAVFGPSSGAARVEGSKAFSKELMQAAGVPTARALTCTDIESARRAVDDLGGACVVKADGLAAGKGVAVCPDRASALAAIEACLVGRVYGEAGATVVVEELLDGDEVSLLALCHGETARPLAAAQDFKRIGDGDTGPNTGGMGAYSPVPWFDDAATAEAARQVHVAASPSRAASTPDSCSPRTGRGCSSTTSASATRRPRRCWRGSTATSPRRSRPSRTAPPVTSISTSATTQP
jgi:phosphoribosylamine--glycine ligase